MESCTKERNGIICHSYAVNEHWGTNRCDRCFQEDRAEAAEAKVADAYMRGCEVGGAEFGRIERDLRAHIEELERIKAELRDRLNKPCPACGASPPRSKP